MHTRPVLFENTAVYPVMAIQTHTWRSHTYTRLAPELTDQLARHSGHREAVHSGIHQQHVLGSRWDGLGFNSRNLGMNRTQDAAAQLSPTSHRGRRARQRSTAHGTRHADTARTTHSCAESCARGGSACAVGRGLDKLLTLSVSSKRASSLSIMSSPWLFSCSCAAHGRRKDIMRE